MLSRPLQCDICLTADHHVAEDCPLVYAAAYDGDVELISAMLLSLQEVNQRPARASRFPSVSSPNMQEIFIPPDGNCLFGALAVGRSYLEGVVSSMDQRVELGLQCRREYLVKLAERHAIGPGATFAGIDIATALAIGHQWRSVEEYLDVMKLPVRSRRQWGGYSEALLISYEWQVIVAIFAKGFQRESC